MKVDVSSVSCHSPSRPSRSLDRTMDKTNRPLHNRQTIFDAGVCVRAYVSVFCVSMTGTMRHKLPSRRRLISPRNTTGILHY